MPHNRGSQETLNKREGHLLNASLQIDYTHVSGKKWDAMRPDEYISMMSDPGFLGDPLLQTQHLLGMSKWEKITDDYIVGHHQLRAAHLRYADESRAVEEMRGHSHATNEHYYRKVDGEWKFAGLKPYIRWNEYEFEHVFKGFQAPKRT
jgi:scytalone dehydratase